MTIRNSAKCVFGDFAKIATDPDTAITDGAVSLEPGKMFVYAFGQPTLLPGPCPAKIAARKISTRLGLALVQWPNARAGSPSRTWCWAIQKPTV
jgi:hypothetical protein